MPVPQDLREFIDEVDRLGALKVLSGADLDVEVGAITELAAAAPSCSMLLFKELTGAHPDYRLVTNLLHTPQRMALAFGLPPTASCMDIVKHWKAKLSTFQPVQPLTVSESSSSIKTHILTGDKIDLTTMPAARWHERDGGRYLGTGAVTILRDLAGSWINLGVYRIQLHDANTLGLYVSPGKHASKILAAYWEQGSACPVAVSLGQDPMLFLAASQFEPWGSSEYGMAGWLRGEPVKVVQAELTGLPVPANSEIILEGEVPPPSVESRVEGPFGEAPGYYASGSRSEPVIKVELVKQRERPIVHGAPPMRPFTGMHHFAVDARLPGMWNDIEKLGLTDVVGLWQYDRGLTVISVRQQYPGHAKAIAMAAMASRSSYLGRYVMTVDDDIDPSNPAEVMWALSSRTDPAESIDVIKGCWSTYLDARISPGRKGQGDLTTGKAIIDACRPYHWRNEFPEVNRTSPETAQRTAAKWSKELGL